jgi:hypothetical protein
MSLRKKLKKAIKKIGPLGLLAAGPVAGVAAKKLGSAAMLAAPGVGILKSLKKKMRAKAAPSAAPVTNPAEQAQSTAQEEGNRAGMAGTAMGFKRGGMVKKTSSSSGGSSCVGIAKRGFGKALKKSR